jgi:hypothetical protein
MPVGPSLATTMSCPSTLTERSGIRDLYVAIEEPFKLSYVAAAVSAIGVWLYYMFALFFRRRTAAAHR